MANQRRLISRRGVALNLLLAVVVIVGAVAAQPAAADTQATGGSQTDETLPGVGSDGGQVFDRSHSSPDSTSVGAVSQPKPLTLTSPGLVTSFDGLNHFQERFGAPNQFSIEPPDQGLCVGKDGAGNTRVVEVINDVYRVYDAAGAAQAPAPTSLNRFFGYPDAIVRTPAPRTYGPYPTDPSCLYDGLTGRWFVDVLTLGSFNHPGPDGFQHFTGVNRLDIAISKTADPTPGVANWNFFHIDVTDDGTDGTPNDNCTGGPIGLPPGPGTHLTACLGDYPHIGSNGDGIYLTTNEYSFFGNEFHGAVIYAMSKAQLEAADPSTTRVTRFFTGGMDRFGFARNGFTLWPSVTPTSAGYGGGDTASGGTEYFLSSNATAEAHDLGDGSSTAHPSTQLLVWSLTNTSSLNSSPALSLTNAKLDVGLYMPPPNASQKAGNQPLRDCLNNNPCMLTLQGVKDPFAEKPNDINTNDSRMQQVTWFNGSLWGALDTGVSVSSSKQAGIEWFKVSASGGSAGATLANSGYVSLGNDNLAYPAIGITTGGTGVMAFTLVGGNFYPSAGYATIDGGGVGTIHVAALGQGPDDGFSDYKFYGNPAGTTRPRWGDYGAAVPWGTGVWLATEYIGQSCDFSTFERTNFRCFNTRTALANWDTRISLVSAA